jgi:tetratricopeptide (TPR) repeat protein
VALAAIILYARTVGFGWVYDDHLDIVRNTFISSLRHLPEILSTTSWTGADGESHLYRPFALLTYAVNYQISGLDAWSYHLFNVLLHAGVSVLVYRVGRLWGLSAMAAGLGGLLFAVHPVHVEAAAAVFGRKDALAALFTLTMVLSHRHTMTRGGWYAILPVVAYACAMLSKEVGVVGLALVAAHDWRLESDHRLLATQRAVGLYVAYALTFLAYLAVRTSVVGGFGVADTSALDNPLMTATLGTRLLTAVPVVRSVLDWRFLATAAAFGLLAWGFTKPAVRRSTLPLGVLWYAITLFLTSNLLVLVGTIFAERLLYLPSVAFCLLVGAALVWVGRRQRAGAVAVTVALVAAFAVQTLRYANAWRADIPLFRWAVASVPRSAKAHHKLGEELLRAGYLGEGVREVRLALAIAPENLYAAETLEVGRRLITDRYLPTAGGNQQAVEPPADPDELHVLGQLSRERGAFSEAERFWETALSTDSTHAESLADLGLLYLSRADTARAVRVLERGTAQQPPVPGAWFILGRIHLARGERREAELALRRFLTAAGSRYPREVEWALSVLATLGSPQ